MIYPVDGERLREWQDRYHHLHASYLGGFISRIEAVDGLRNLRYRDEALRIELLEWVREKDHLRAERNAERERMKNERRRARYQRDIHHEP